MNLEVKVWSDKLGILPVNFLHNQSTSNSVHALLDGPRNNFCLSFDYQYDPEEMLNNIWSANMSNFIAVKDDQLLLYNIKNGLQPETIPYSVVLWDLVRFKKYLGSISLPEEETIVPFVMEYFRQIRFDLREYDSAANSLKLFLYIISKLDSEKRDWKLPEGIDDAKACLRSNSLLDDVISNLKKGTHDGLKPDVNMILRHCAGHLFQEANYMAQFSPQLELFVTSNYQIMRSQRQVGSYFTPLYIARTIVEETLKQIDALNQEELVIFDPACGSGVFLVEALRQLRSGGFDGNVHVIGWDIDPLAKAMADFVLQYESTEWNNRVKISIINNDSLSHYNEWPKSDAIFMNPPYISWSLMNSEQRDQVTTITGRSSNNRPNLAFLFYMLGAQSLKENGCVGSLMPSSFLSTEAAREIRNKANGYARPVLVCNLGGFIFDSAMADVTILIATNKESNPKVQMVWTKNREDVAPVALQELRRLNEKSIRISESSDFNIYETQFSHLQESQTWKCLSRDSFRLKRNILSLLNNNGFKAAGEIFEIKQGARTGANNIFIVSSEYYHSLPKSEKLFFRPSVDNASVTAGHLSKTNYLFFPYSKDSLIITDEKSLKQAVPTYYKTHLESEKKRLAGRSKIDLNKWWALTWPRNWQFEKTPKMVSTEFGKAGSFAYDETGEYVVERGLAWIPYGDSFNQPDYYKYIALMNAPFFDCLLELFSNELIGGVYNLETKYVKNIPLPLFDHVDDDVATMLYDYGRQMSNEKPVNLNMLDVIVRTIYGER